MICPKCCKVMIEVNPECWHCSGCNVNMEQLTIFEGVDELRFNIDIEPMPAVRMTGRGKYIKPYAQKYLNYKTFIGLKVREQYKVEPLDGPLKVNIYFSMPIPKSWSKKKQEDMLGKHHTSTPDIDNLIKGLFDSINKIIWVDDARVVEVRAVKIYGVEPGITFTVN